MKINFKASPGIAIILEVEDKDTTSLIRSQKVQGRIIKGKIISMGMNDTTNQGATIVSDNYAKEGDIVYFLHYFEEGGVDVGMIDGIKYYFVKFGDIRAVKV